MAAVEHDGLLATTIFKACFGTGGAILLWRLRLQAAPDEVMPFERQAGGHQAFRSRRTGFFLKPIQQKQKFEQTDKKPANVKSRTELEGDFYAEVAHLRSSSSLHRVLATFLPKCEGMKLICGNRYLALEDLTANYQCPCILDLKMGTIVTEPGIPVDEAEKRRLKYPLQEVFGYRIVGMHVFNVNEGVHKHYKKSFAKSLTTEQMEHGEGLLAFVNNGSGSHRMDVLRAMRDQIRPIIDWFEDQQSYTFFSSSLLFIYEGSEAAAKLNTPSLTVKMIDHAHVLTSVEGPDTGYIEGLRNLARALDSVLP
jgi:hypothetical protein